MNILTNKKLIKIVVIVLLVIVFISGVGPIVISFFMRSVMKKEPIGKLQTVPLMVQVKGKISITDNNVVLTGAGEKKYILVGEKVNELKKFVDKEISVFGNIMKADPLSIEGRLVRFNIDVKKYGDSLEIGKKVTKDEFAKIQEKILQKTKFREEILSKLNKKPGSFEVLKGKIGIEKKELLKDSGITADYLILTTEHNDKYVLVGPISENMKKNIKNYENKILILLGEISLPTRAYPIVETNLITFIVRETYDEELKPL
ncbi:MAG: hypothetical protein SNJ64_06455 [Endomicrobiia bacterium]